MNYCHDHSVHNCGRCREAALRALRVTRHTSRKKPVRLTPDRARRILLQQVLAVLV